VSAPSSRAVARRRRLVVVLVVLLALGAAAWGVSRSPLLDVDHVAVSGNARVTTAEILASSGIRRGDAMVWLDPGVAARHVEALPWIGSADVRREWPGTVRIAVRERVPVAWVDAGAGRALVVDRTGRGLSLDPAAPPGLPQLLGVKPAPVGGAIHPAGGAWLAGHLTLDQLGLVASIAVADARATLRVSSGEEVRFGRLDQVADKMRSAQAVLAQPGVAARAYVDVSVPSMPVAGGP
jgi:cell division protein FtsQ